MLARAALALLAIAPLSCGAMPTCERSLTEAGYLEEFVHAECRRFHRCDVEENWYAEQSEEDCRGWLRGALDRAAEDYLACGASFDACQASDELARTKLAAAGDCTAWSSYDQAYGGGTCDSGW